MARRVLFTRMGETVAEVECDDATADVIIFRDKVYFKEAGRFVEGRMAFAELPASAEAH